MACGRLMLLTLLVGLGIAVTPADSRAAPPDYGAGPQGIIRQGAIPPIDAFPFPPLFGYPAANLGSPQPRGHQIIPTGPNGYVYRPVTDLGKLIELGIAALRSGDYEAVLIQLEPVVTERPEEGYAWLIRAQAFFALGRYAEAAQSLHTAMRLLPEERWGGPVAHFRDYFASAEEYKTRLRTLERYTRAHPHDPASHFVLGYHLGYLGHGDAAARELAKAIGLVTGGDAEAQPARPTDDDERPRPGLPREEPKPAPVHQPREF